MTTDIQGSPTRQDIFLNKLTKVGGSTTAGINIRIAISIARGYANTTNSLNTTNNSTSDKMDEHSPLCRGRWDHARAVKMQCGQRNLDHSFIWTVVREPTKRGP
jgi:hypothetical protein